MMKKLTLLFLALSNVSFANDKVTCWVNLFERFDDKLKSVKREATSSYYLEKTIALPISGEVSLENSNKDHSYLVRFKDAKAVFMSVRAEKEGISATSHIITEIPKDSRLEIVLRKEITKQKTIFASLECAWQSWLRTNKQL